MFLQRHFKTTYFKAKFAAAGRPIVYSICCPYDPQFVPTKGGWVGQPNASQGGGNSWRIGCDMPGRHNHPTEMHQTWVRILAPVQAFFSGLGYFRMRSCIDEKLGCGQVRTLGS